VHGVHASLTAARITVTGVPDHAGATAAVFRVIAELEVTLGLVSQNPAGAPTGRTAIAFTVARSAGPVVLGALRAVRARIGFHRACLEDDVAVVTLTGAGLRSDPVIPATFCEVLARRGVRMETVSIENSQISVACGKHELETAVRALCEAFEVGASCQVGRPSRPASVDGAPPGQDRLPGRPGIGCCGATAGGGGLPPYGAFWEPRTPMGLPGGSAQ
jgi:aspartate kinase